MKIFSWKTGFFYNADAQKVGEELEEIERNSTLEANHIIEYAERHKDSELYKCFEWDDTEAARKWRLRQAGMIITNISLEIKEEPRKLQRVYVSVKDKDTEERVFKNVNEVLNNDEEYQQLIEKAKIELIRCKEKYETLLNKEDLKEIIFDIYRKV